MQLFGSVCGDGFGRLVEMGKLGELQVMMMMMMMMASGKGGKSVV